MKLLNTIACIVILLMMTGCAASLVIVSPANESLDHYQNLEIMGLRNDIVGEINTRVMDKIMTKSVKGISELRRFDKLILADYIMLDDTEGVSPIMRSSTFDKGDTSNTAILQMALTEYDEGNGLIRFLFSPFAGTGKVTWDLTLMDKPSGRVLMKAKTTAKITGSFSGVGDTATPLAKAIKNFIEDNFKRKSD